MFPLKTGLLMSSLDLWLLTCLELLGVVQIKHVLFGVLFAANIDSNDSQQLSLSAAGSRVHNKAHRMMVTNFLSLDCKSKPTVMCQMHMQKVHRINRGDCFEPTTIQMGHAIEAYYIQ